MVRHSLLLDPAQSELKAESYNFLPPARVRKCEREGGRGGASETERRERERDGNPFQKQACHPDVKPMPAAAAAATLFLDMISGSRIINWVELCHYITEQSLTITTLGESCHQFVFFFSSFPPSPASNENVWSRAEEVEKILPSIASVSTPYAQWKWLSGKFGSHTAFCQS